MSDRDGEDDSVPTVWKTVARKITLMLASNEQCRKQPTVWKMFWHLVGLGLGGRRWYAIVWFLWVRGRVVKLWCPSSLLHIGTVSPPDSSPSIPTFSRLVSTCSRHADTLEPRCRA